MSRALDIRFALVREMGWCVQVEITTRRICWLSDTDLRDSFSENLDADLVSMPIETELWHFHCSQHHIEEFFLRSVEMM